MVPELRCETQTGSERGFDVGEMGSSKPLSYFSGIFPYHSGLDEHDSSA